MNCGGTCSTNQVNKEISKELLDKTNRHPCYSAGAHHKYARMHLPVAPKCNIGCNYCNRKYDCVNESRPGVTSEILNPDSALAKYKLVKEKIENLSVVGIAGPGDALANWQDTKESIQLIKNHDPMVVFCLSTNGLMLEEYAQEIIDLGVNHVTVTLNTIDPEIGAKLYKFVNYKGQNYSGVDGAKILLENQLKGIALLTSADVLVKINIVMVKGINDQHIPEVVKKVKSLGVFITNIMPLIPAAGSAFEDFPQTSTKELNAIRDICQLELPQMRHCQQCRADAIGLLGEDRSREFSQVTTGSSSEDDKVVQLNKIRKTYKIAVATKYGKLVDEHFGYASEFVIYESDGSNFNLLEKRPVTKYCLGVEECEPSEQVKKTTVKDLKDCDAVISMRIGYSAKQNLLENGIVSVETCDTIENGLVETIQKLIKAG